MTGGAAVVRPPSGRAHPAGRPPGPGGRGWASTSPRHGATWPAAVLESVAFEYAGFLDVARGLFPTSPPVTCG